MSRPILSVAFTVRLFDKLLDVVKTKSKNRSLHIDQQLISRIDDILEDVVTINVTSKLILESINQHTQLSMSTRETDRLNRNMDWDRLIKENNLLPFMFLIFSNQYIQSNHID